MFAPLVSSQRINSGNDKMQDLPLAVLSQLVDTVHEHDSRRSLFGTCKLLRDLTLTQSHHTECLIDVSTVTHTQAARSLQLLATCKEGAEVKLVLKDGVQPDCPQRDDEQRACVFSDWFYTLCREHSSALSCVTNVELQGYVYGDMVPVEVQRCCPKMTHFTRWGWLWDGPSATSGYDKPCLQLQHLTILEPCPSGASNLRRDRSVTEKVRLQLSRLPNLQSLQCWDCFRLQWECSALQPLRTHLKSLAFTSQSGLTTPLLRNSWPQLQRLEMVGERLPDHYLDALLRQTPQLEELVVGRFILKHSFADRECKWRRLTATELTCTCLARLPQAALNTLRFDDIRFREPDLPYLQLARDRLNNIPHVESVKPRYNIHVRFDFILPEEQLAVLVALLQKLPQDHICMLPDTPLQPAWLHVLQQLQWRVLKIDYNWLPPSWWGTLLHDLPHLEILDIDMFSFWRRQVDERRAQELVKPLATFCKHAHRPCTLQIGYFGCKLALGWQAQLEAIMKDAGHQHVSILGPPDDNDGVDRVYSYRTIIPAGLTPPG